MDWRAFEGLHEQPLPTTGCTERCDAVCDEYNLLSFLRSVLRLCVNRQSSALGVSGGWQACRQRPGKDSSRALEAACSMQRPNPLTVSIIALHARSGKAATPPPPVGPQQEVHFV